MKMVKESSGRYEVRGNVLGAEMRLGLVLGGKSRWTAETSSGDTLGGAFPTARSAAQALENDATDPLWLRMRAFAGGHGLPRQHRDDLKIDRRTLRAWRGVPGMRFIWLLRENGSNFMPVSTAWSHREVRATLMAFADQFTRKDVPAVIALVDATTDTVRAITPKRADEEIDRPPVYRIDNERRVVLDRDDQIVCGLDIAGQTSHLAVVRVLATGVHPRMEPLMRSAASAWFTHCFGTMFGPSMAQILIEYREQKKVA